MTIIYLCLALYGMLTLGYQMTSMVFDAAFLLKARAVGDAG